MIPQAERAGNVRLGLVSLFAMGFATFTISVLGILGPFLIRDVGITRAQLGLLIAAGAVSGAPSSFFIGSLTDRIGAYAALGLLGVVSATTLTIYSASGAFLFLALGALLGGLAQALSNPVTNKLIALHISPGARGVVTGVKQSGVYVMVTIAGLAIPAGELVFGWRVTLVLFAGAAAGFTVAALIMLPNDRVLAPRLDRRSTSRTVPSAVWWIMVYGFLHGSAGSFSFAFSLYAIESLGRSEQFAGLVVSLAALGALVGRILWARAAETRLGFSTPLLAIGAVATISVSLILAAGAGPVWLAVVGGVGFGASTNSWNSVGMLAVMTMSGSADTGRGTGIILTGFLTGLGVGPPTLGWLLDQTGSYKLVWSIHMAAFAASVLLIVGWRWFEKGEGQRAP